MLGSGKRVHEVENDEAKAVVHLAVAAVVGNIGMAVAARSFARPWRRHSAFVSSRAMARRKQRSGSGEADGELVVYFWEEQGA
jgi:hypothetical protein